MFNISEATEKDIPAIIRIAEETWWPTYTPILPEKQIRFMLNAIYTPENIREQMTGRIQTYLLLADADGPQAFASFGKRPDDPSIHKLHKLYVLPSHHKKGYAQALIKHIILHLLGENVHTLDVNVNRFNPARSFYERVGFKLLREEDVPIGPYWMNDFVMRITF